MCGMISRDEAIDLDGGNRRKTAGPETINFYGTGHGDRLFSNPDENGLSTC